ncbi:hypothetical protein [Microbulbifer sp. M83]|uniref:hypothetical protein n=1 Tax=Microbulbifer sp. M83 TaxID=3118246 RepID=UPI002FE0D4FF
MTRYLMGMVSGMLLALVGYLAQATSLPPRDTFWLSAMLLLMIGLITFATFRVKAFRD